MKTECILSGTWEPIGSDDTCARDNDRAKGTVSVYELSIAEIAEIALAGELGNVGAALYSLCKRRRA